MTSWACQWLLFLIGDLLSLKFWSKQNQWVIAPSIFPVVTQVPLGLNATLVKGHKLDVLKKIKLN